MPDIIHHQTAANALAVCAVQLFPDIQLVQAVGTGKYFFCDLIFDCPFEPHFLRLLEERMRFICREKKECRTLEMTPSNAAQMFVVQGQKAAAERLRNMRAATISICQIESYTLYAPNPYLKELILPPFKLLEAIGLDLPGPKITRIIGSCEIKKAGLRPKQEVWFDGLGEGRWLWLPQAEKIRQKLVALWIEECGKQNIYNLSSAAAQAGEEKELMQCHLKTQERHKINRSGEIAYLTTLEEADPIQGLFCPASGFVDRAYIFCSEGKLLEECISSLHFITKISKILGFECEIVLSVSGPQLKAPDYLRQALERLALFYKVEGNRAKVTREGVTSIELRVEDALGQRWTSAFLRLKELKGRGGYLVISSSYHILERTVALLLEKKSAFIN